MAWVEIVKEFQSKERFNEFTDNRKNFEEYLIECKFLTNQVTLKYGSGLKGYMHLKKLYLSLLKAVISKKDSEDILKLIGLEYPFLNIQYKGDQPQGSDFNSNTKSEIFINSALKTAHKCCICNGYIHVKSISIDHIERKEEGGIGNSQNGQLTHPYCNTTYKN